MWLKIGIIGAYLLMSIITNALFRLWSPNKKEDWTTTILVGVFWWGLLMLGVFYLIGKSYDICVEMFQKLFRKVIRRPNEPTK